MAPRAVSALPRMGSSRYKSASPGALLLPEQIGGLHRMLDSVGVEVLDLREVRENVERLPEPVKQDAIDRGVDGLGEGRVKAEIVARSKDALED